eukprot:2068716-Rhodomonas_salina.2
MTVLNTYPAPPGSGPALSSLPLPVRPPPRPPPRRSVFTVSLQATHSIPSISRVDQARPFHGPSRSWLSSIWLAFASTSTVASLRRGGAFGRGGAGVMHCASQGPGMVEEEGERGGFGGSAIEWGLSALSLSRRGCKCEEQLVRRDLHSN